MSLRLSLQSKRHIAPKTGHRPINKPNAVFLGFYQLISLLLVCLLVGACNMGAERHKRRGSFSSFPEKNPKSSADGEETSDSDLGQQDQADGENLSPAALALTPETLVWKRYRAFEDGLSQGLQVDKARLCTELGQHSCIDKVHLTVLGGNEPYSMGQYEAARSPTILTGIAVDRIVLAACEARLTLDQGLGAGAVVFKSFPLNAADVTTEQVRNQTASLYQRLLARDATAEELTIAQDILKITKTGNKVAMALCYAVGSQLENIFL